MFFGLIIGLILLIICDFYTIYNNIKKEDQIDKKKCLNEYEMNYCDTKMNEGPLINDYCLERLKCMEKNTPLFHLALVGLIRSFSFHLFVDISFLNKILIFIIIMVIFAYFVINQGGNNIKKMSNMSLIKKYN